MPVAMMVIGCSSSGREPSSLEGRRFCDGDKWAVSSRSMPKHTAHTANYHLARQPFLHLSNIYKHWVWFIIFFFWRGEGGAEGSIRTTTIIKFCFPNCQFLFGNGRSSNRFVFEIRKSRKMVLVFSSVLAIKNITQVQAFWFFFSSYGITVLKVEAD